MADRPKSVGDVLNIMKEKDVKFFDLRFTDTKGKLQHVTADGSVVNEGMFAEGYPFDGSSIAGWKGIEASDMILMPDLAGLDEVHVAGRERHRLPVETAFQQQRAAGAGGALEALLQLGLEAVVLLGGEVAVAGGVDERAGGAGGVVEEGLVPARGGVVDVYCRGGRLDGGETVVVGQRMEQLDVQDAGHAGHGLAGDALGPAVGRVVEGLG